MKFSLPSLQTAVRQQPVDGWLFYGFQHRDPLADELLGVAAEAVNSRRWFYLLHQNSEESLKICHTIEAGILDHLPGRRFLYSSYAELKEQLLEFSGMTLAAQTAADLPVLSYLDAGTARLLTEAGVRLVSSAMLIQNIKGTLDEDGVASHCRAADHLAEIVDIFAARVQSALRDGEPLSEGALQRLILAEFEQRGLETDHPPIVACGEATADPHYAPRGEGNPIRPDRLLQLDLWARERTQQGIYADISWVFYTGAEVPQEAARLFSTVASARDRVLAFLEEELPRRPVAGSEADAAAREVILSAGYGRGLRHRTGHGIDTLPHGYGVNLDSVEFPDPRTFVEGSCFSIEPGVYLQDFGMRTEINAYIRNNQPLVTGRPPQREIVALGPSGAAHERR